MNHAGYTADRGSMAGGQGQLLSENTFTVDFALPTSFPTYLYFLPFVYSPTYQETNPLTESPSPRQNSNTGYTANPVACGWAGTVMEKVTGAFGQER